MSLKARYIYLRFEIESNKESQNQNAYQSSCGNIALRLSYEIAEPGGANVKETCNRLRYSISTINLTTFGSSLAVV